MDEPMICANPERFGETEALKLQTNRPLVFVRDALPNHSRDEIWEWLDIAHNHRWGSVCDWQVRRIMAMEEADQGDYVNLITVADLGGSGVLADQMLPYSGGNVLTMRINTRRTWKATDGQMQGGAVDPVRTLTHEIGHFMGHSHWPVGNPFELMEPTLSQTIIGPQPTEAAMSAAWFGKTLAPPTPDDEGMLIQLLIKKNSLLKFHIPDYTLIPKPR